ncbi:DNA polymerase I, partial [archaeon]
IELRLLAHFIGQGNLVDALQQQDDIFLSISAAWYHKSIQDVSPAERQATKQICYAIIYGAGCRHIAEELSMSVDEAESMYHSFLQAFPEILMFVEKVKEQCAEIGYVRTLLGRRRKLKHIHSKEPALRAKAERQAVNTLCQGSAADLIKVRSTALLCV